MRPLYRTTIVLWTEEDPAAAVEGLAERLVEEAGVVPFVTGRERIEWVRNPDHDPEWAQLWDDDDGDADGGSVVECKEEQA
jgi:hypothetical protein